MSNQNPHIVFILADDIGWNDWSYNNPLSPIKTERIDTLANEGIQLKQFYMHSLCTPSRASLLTGRYHVNTGLTYVLAPGTPAGLPSDIPTLPDILKERRGYKTAMVGKWHLGHGQRKATPTGRGFESFTGIYMWDTDSYTKQMHELPWEPPLMIDWVSEFNNGSFHHYAEPRHATDAITQETQAKLVEHAANHPDSPLFLYVAYTAAHSPLQPLPRHEPACAHIDHLWRRQFCGMVMGIDEGVYNITSTIRKTLGDNVIVVVTSDNGGSPWFGGMNQPLRGAKITPFEGGVRVPGFILDYTRDKRYIGESGPHREYHGLMHVSDWLPTLLSFAGVDKDVWPKRLDGFDFSGMFKQVPRQIAPGTKFTHSPRSEMLLEMYFPDEFIFKEGLMAYRYGDYKLIKGLVRDDNYYSESSVDAINISHPSFTTNTGEWAIRLGDSIYGNNHFDLVRITFVHVFLQNSFTARQKNGDPKDLIRLYNVAEDPNETTNLADLPSFKSIIEKIEQRLEFYKENRLRPEPAHMIYGLGEWRKTHLKGDCSMNPAIPPEQCVFTHPWVPDDVDIWSQLDTMVSAADHSTYRVNQMFKRLGVTLAIVIAICFFMRRLFRSK